MSFAKHKKEIEEKNKPKTDEELFGEMCLNESDIEVLKIKVLKEEISIPALINLVLFANDAQVLNEETKQELIIRRYVSTDSKITEEGMMYIESDIVKERLGKLLNE